MIGEELKAKRKALGISLRELAKILGISYSSIGRIERGGTGMTDDTRYRLRQWLEHGERSAPRARIASWMTSVDQRLTRIEAALGLSANN